MKASGVILDLDGPILDGRDRHYRCYSDILLENGFVPIPAGDYWEMKRSRADRRTLLAASGAECMYDQFLQSWLDRIERREYLELDRLQPGLLGKLRSWKADGLELVLITMRNNENNLMWQLERLGVLVLLDHVFAVGTSKPVEQKADAARPFVEKHGTDAVWWIGDTEVDVEAARALGVRICAVDCGLRTRDFLAGLGPDQLLSSVAAAQLNEGFAF